MIYFYKHLVARNFHTPCYYKYTGKERRQEGFEGAEGNGVYLVKTDEPQKTLKYPASPRIFIMNPTISPHTYGFDYDTHRFSECVRHHWGFNVQL